MDGAALRARAGALLAALLAAGSMACEASPRSGEAIITIPGAVLGAEGQVLLLQAERFSREHPGIRIVLQPTPYAADQRHQLYVQWLNARASDPDILQMDMTWIPEFAAAGWIMALDRFGPPVEEFFAPTIEAARLDDGRLYALPWFVDVGMLYWRTDIMESPPRTFGELAREAQRARSQHALPYGLLLQAARYEGLVTVFLEILGGFGGEIMDSEGRVTVDSEAAVRALDWMRDAIYELDIVPRTSLTWHEEETRFGFQNGQAAFMRNWPYAFALMQDSAESRVAGRFAVTAMPAAPGGRPTAALGGQQLAINANTDHPEAAWAVLEYLTRPEQMLERARVAGQYPTRVAVYDDPRLAEWLAIPPRDVREIVERAVPRPATPVYTQLSEILQIRLHRALTRQQEPEAALYEAATEMRALLGRAGLTEGKRSLRGS